jgi:hypothetical protein
LCKLLRKRLPPARVSAAVLARSSRKVVDIWQVNCRLSFVTVPQMFLVRFLATWQARSLVESTARPGTKAGKQSSTTILASNFWLSRATGTRSVISGMFRRHSISSTSMRLVLATKRANEPLESD